MVQIADYWYEKKKGKEANQFAKTKYKRRINYGGVVLSRILIRHLNSK